VAVDPREVGPIAVVVDSSGRDVLNEDGEPIGVYRQHVSERQMAENARRGRGRNVVWSSNTRHGDEYPYARSEVVKRFQHQACVEKRIGPGFRLTEYGRACVAQCASRPAVVEPPAPPPEGGPNARERRRLRRAEAARGSAQEAREREATAELDRAVGAYVEHEAAAEEPAGQVGAPPPEAEEPPGALWTDRELFERLSESPAERAARERRLARLERRLARERALDELLAPILERARAQTEREAERRRGARERRRKKS
jgi:hypothetical protein